MMQRLNIMMIDFNKCGMILNGLYEVEFMMKVQKV